MAHFLHESVNTKSFTLKQYQGELLDHAWKSNILICLGTKSSKLFIATKVIHELSHPVRRKWKEQGKRTIYITPSATTVSFITGYIGYMTDLSVAGFSDIEAAQSWDSNFWEEHFTNNMVLVMVPEIFLLAITKGYIQYSRVNLLVLDQCQRALERASPLNLLMREYEKASGPLPRIFGLTPPMFEFGCDARRLDFEFSRLEKAVHCRVETSSDVVSVLRQTTRPKEWILEHGLREPGDLDRELRKEVEFALEFLNDHRYDPSEIYDEEFHEEIQGIPDPTIEPKQILNDFLDVLHDLGPWCADRAAYLLLVHLEKLKVQTPYERHFLLLCMTSSVLVKLRAICDHAFEPYEGKGSIYAFSSPKIIRLLEIFKQFKPPKSNIKCEDCAKKTAVESSGKPSDLSHNVPAKHDLENVKCDKIELPNKHNPGVVSATNNDRISRTQRVRNASSDLALETVTKAVAKLSTANAPERPGPAGEITRRIFPDYCYVCSKRIPTARELEFQNSRGRGMGRGKPKRGGRKGGETNQPVKREVRIPYDMLDPDALCCLLFVQKEFTAKIIYNLLYNVRKSDEDLIHLQPQFVIEKPNDSPMSRYEESDLRKQEEALKRFRMHDCNVLIATSVLEEGIDTPKCNLVVRFDRPLSYRSYVHSKGRARANVSNYVMLVEEENSAEFIKQLAEFVEIEEVLLKRCAGHEDLSHLEKEADRYTDIIVPYKTDLPDVCATLGNAVSLVNHYCAKLPSDTFTRLTPIWWMDTCVTDEGVSLYRCTLRLPINSPLKQPIVGAAVPNPVLARRLTSLKTIALLHSYKEVDDRLIPIGKESFRLLTEEKMTSGPDWGPLPDDDKFPVDSDEPRPGTTKRRQYYYKRIADVLTDCRPVTGAPCLLYHINMKLTCPLPEEQNTRGRRIYPPEESSQNFAILTLKKISKICPFPIFTRSGEVEVSIQLVPTKVELTEERIEKIIAFLNYTFTSVLRLQKYLMLFDPNAAENSYFVVPTRKTETGSLEVDWEFLDRIYDKRDLVPMPISQKDRKEFQFDAAKYQDAVVMPWYRNQDQPQYFYVAEICTGLTPMSSFPSSGDFDSFQEYYFKKYGIKIQNLEQPLLDVDHTSARLNFLTPRYVNRKGVALPTSSEETKRAKRENLEQKQILVPELCTVHPFPASLWRKAVCLPCILYRINSLLLADQVRRQVSRDIGLGEEEGDEDYKWEPLNFGWSLADVLKASNEKKEEDDSERSKLALNSIENSKLTETDDLKQKEDGESEKNKDDKSWMEIGTWSNEFATNQRNFMDEEEPDPDGDLPSNLTMLINESDTGSSGWGEISKTKCWDTPPSPTNPPNRDDKKSVRYGSPTNLFGEPSPPQFNPDPFDMSDSDLSYSDDDSGSEDDDEPSHDIAAKDSGTGMSSLRIEFKSDNVAEALEDDDKATNDNKIPVLTLPDEESWQWLNNSKAEDDETAEKISKRFEENIKRNAEVIGQSGRVVKPDEPFVAARGNSNKANPFYVPNGIIDTVNNVTDLSALNYIDIEGTQIVDTSNLQFTVMTDCGLPAVSCDDDFEETDKTDEVDLVEERLNNDFSFDYQPVLEGHPGPSPAVILQALTMSNANDGINLERLETIGDSFLKYAITAFLYISYDRIHEGKLSHMRSKQVSNLNLYRLGRRKDLGENIIATKFEPHDNWLPPCYYVPRDLEIALIEAGVPASHWNRADLPSLRTLTAEEISQKVYERKETLMLANITADSDSDDDVTLSAAMTQKRLEELQQQQIMEELRKYYVSSSRNSESEDDDDSSAGYANSTCHTKSIIRVGDKDLNDFSKLGALSKIPTFIPYNLITQHSIPDKSIADCVEALIGAYLIACGPRGALLFMAWLGIQVLPWEEVTVEKEHLDKRRVGSLSPVQQPDGSFKQMVMTTLDPPPSPLLRHIPDPEKELARLLDGYDLFERSINYRFRDKSYLLQSLTHASYWPNQLTDCYQRLEFLGDAVLDYLITRHLYEDWRQHSPGALTDLRSALVNNTIFASLAVRFGFHKYFRHLSPGLNEVIDRFVHRQEANGHAISEEYYLTEAEENEEQEDVEVPKALGDVFESVAGAIFLDSGMSLDAVWRVYYRMMHKEIELFSTNVPKSPIRELLELEPETAKFGKPEKLADGRRVRVTVEVFSKGIFKGIGRNYRIAKCTAAKCALKQLKKKGLIRDKREFKL